MHTFAYTQNLDPSALGKNPKALFTRQWVTASGTIEDLAQWAYVGGRTFAHGVFNDSPLADREKTPRTEARWLGSEIIVLDVDDDANVTLGSIKADKFIQQYAACVMPSSSHNDAQTKAHIVFLLDRRLSSKFQYKALGELIASKIGLAIDTSTLTATQPLYGTLFTHPDYAGHNRTLDDGLIYINENAALIPCSWVDGVEDQQHNDVILARRTVAHESAPHDKRLHVTLEALRFALVGWGSQDRERRLPLLMAAYAACNDMSVCEAFMSHSNPRWDASSQKANLVNWWLSHVPKKDGYTAATLFYLARQNGWLQQGTVELQNALDIHAGELGDWLLDTYTELPSRLLIKSATGTGKTQGAIRLLKELGTPKAVFFAPSIKLCMALSQSLTNAGVDNVLYIGTDNKTKDHELLQSANVLVTTLQTFATKVTGSGVKPSAYKLVVVDECDELFAAFVKSGAGNRVTQASHVNREQAGRGFDAVHKLFSEAETVLLLDGTATMVSQHILTSLSGAHEVGVYVNTYKRNKADVALYHEQNSIRQRVLDDVRAGFQCVVATDTKKEALLIEKLLELSGAARPDEMIRITGDTVADSRVLDFFKDVEAGAAAYRVVIYNSAMGSGVSIVNTKPERFFLVASYLNPRKLLQLINRYRQQWRVDAYVANRESLYSEGVNDRFLRVRTALDYEQELTGFTRATPETLTQVIDTAAVYVVQDEYDQSRSVKDFFIGLLRDEGRRVFDEPSYAHNLDDLLTDVYEMLGQYKELVLSGWRNVAPIDRGTGVPVGLTDLEVSQGYLHAYILRLFQSVPPNYEGLTDAEIAEIALKFQGVRWVLDKVLHPENIIESVIKDLSDSRTETLSFRMYAAKVEILNAVALLIPELNKTYTLEDLEANALKFVKEIAQREAVYNTVASAHLSYDNVEAREDSIVERAATMAGALLKAVGLRLKRKNGKRREDGSRERVLFVEGLQELSHYVKLRYGQDKPLALDFAKFKDISKHMKQASYTYQRLDPTDRRDVLETMRAIEGLTLGESLAIVESKRLN